MTAAGERLRAGGQAHLRRSGFALLRQGKGDHEIWRHPTSGLKVTVDGSIKSRHTANKILKDAGLPKAF